MDTAESMTKSSSSQYPGWLYFFPMYIMLFCYALLGRTGYTVVADVFDPENPFPPSEFVLYYILTYCIIFPIIFISQWIYYRLLSKRAGVYWRDFALIDKGLIFFYNILGFLFYL
ncbi:MAG TPA: hypothetical protein VMV49_04240 [Candidatus Deferrimicrobium sp.]|nr:hypothetical protein [Candidatus Deferrimicrobium sp.]